MTYTLSALAALERQAMLANREAKHRADIYNNAKLHKLLTPALIGNKVNSETIARRSTANVKAYTSRWNATGRTGALEALRAKYPNLDAVTKRLNPFDPQGAVDNINAKRTLDQNLINLTNQENQVNSQYGNSRQQFEQKVPELSRRLLSSYAGRGMAFSSGYGDALGNQQRDITNELSNLDQQKATALADIVSQRGLSNTGYQNDLASSLINTTSRLSSKAGTLGFGPKGRDIYNDPTLLVKLAQKLLTGG